MSNVLEVRQMLHKISPQLKRNLPAQIKSETFCKTVLMALERNPYLAKFSAQSIVKAAELAAIDGLMLDGREAALVPFGKEIQYLPMYGGIQKINLSK